MEGWKARKECRPATLPALHPILKFSLLNDVEFRPDYENEKRRDFSEKGGDCKPPCEREG